MLNFGPNPTFTLTSGIDTLANGVSDGIDDLIAAPVSADLQSFDTVDGGTGTDQIEVVAAGVLTDSQFTGVSNVEALWLAASGNYTVTLGEAAQAAGIVYVNAFDTSGKETIDTHGMTQGVEVDTGAGVNILTGGVGQDTYYVTSELLTGADKIDGGGFAGNGGVFAHWSIPGNDVISIYDKATLVDSQLAGVKNIEEISVSEGGTPMDVIGQKITLGKASEAAGIITVSNDYAYGLTVDASNRTTKALNFWGSDGDDVFIGTATAGAGSGDAFDGWRGNDSYRVKAENFDDQDWYNGRQGFDEIRILDSYDGKNAATKIIDADFTQMISVERLAFDGTGKQDVTLAAKADATGLEVIDASKVAGGLTLDATGMDNSLEVLAGTGADKILLGGAGGAENQVLILSTKLNAADQIDGGGAADRELHFTNAVKLTDANFSGLKVTNFDGLDFDSDAVGQSLTAGANFAAFIAASGIDALTATSDSDKSSFTFDFSNYTGGTLTVQGGAGNDVFIAGAVDMHFIGSDPAAAAGDADSFRFRSADFDGGDTLEGGSGVDEIVILDTGTPVVDTDFLNVTGVEVLRLAAAKSGGYSVTLGADADAAGIDKVDAAQAGVDVTVNAAAATNDLTILAGVKSNAITGGSGDDDVVIDVKSFNAGDTLTGGVGADTLRFTTGGTIATSAFAATTGFEILQLSDAGNKVVVPDALVQAADTGADLNVNGAFYDTFDFLVQGGKGNDSVDLSNVAASAYVGIVANGGVDNVVGSAGDNPFFFTKPGELTAADKIDGGDGYDWVVGAAGTYTSDQFKGFKNVEEFAVFDADPTKGSSITIKNDYFTHATPDSGSPGAKSLSIWIDHSMTGDDTIDASAVTGALNDVSVFSSGGDDTIIGGAGSEWLLFRDDGNGAFTLNAGDSVSGGSNFDNIALRNLDSPKGATLADADLAGVVSVEQIIVTPESIAADIDITLGANAAAAGILQVRGYEFDVNGNPDYFTGNLTVDASSYADGQKVDSGVMFLAGGGDDTFLGSSEDDTVRFLDNDKLTDDDTIDGASGKNRIQFYGSQAVTDAQLAEVSNVQVLQLRRDADHITLGANADAAGISRVDASGMDSATVAGAVIDLSAMTHGVEIIGSTRQDTITGGSGNDVIVGGAGADDLTGGGGDDTFVFANLGDSLQNAAGSPAPNHMDFIEDFDAGDKIDISAFGLTSSIDVHASGAFVTADTPGFFGAFNVVVQYDNVADATRLYVDVNNDGNLSLGKDLVVELDGDQTGNLNDDTTDVIFSNGSGLRPNSTFPHFGESSTIVFSTAKSYTDADFSGAGKDTLVLSATKGNYSVTLGANAEASGITAVDASAATGAVSVDASGVYTGMLMIAGKGANTLTGTVDDDVFVFTSAGLTAADKVNGHDPNLLDIVGNDTIHDTDTILITDKAALTDAAFTGVRNIDILELGTLGTQGDVTGQKATLGANSEAAGISSVSNDYDVGLTVDASGRTKGLEFDGWTADEVFIASKGDDGFDGEGGNDSFRVKLANLDGNDWFDGGLGTDEVRILDSFDAKNSVATSLVDGDFEGFASVERLVFDGTGEQVVTLGDGNDYADGSGLEMIDASKVAGGLTLDATGMNNALEVIAGTGADNIQLGGSGGLENQVLILSSKLNAADQLDGGDATFRDLRLTDAVKLTDAYFAGLTKVTSFTNLMFDNAAAGQSLTAGANFAAFVADAGIGFVTETSSNTKESFTFDFSNYSGKSLSVEGGAGDDIFVAGQTDMQFLAAGPGTDRGDADSFRFKSQYFDGNDTIDGGSGGADEVVLLDDGGPIADASFNGIVNVEILRLAAAKSGSYSLTLGGDWDASGLQTVNAALAGVDVTIDACGTSNGLLIMAGSKINTITGGDGDDVVEIDAKSFDKNDTIDGGNGSDTLQFTTGGAIAAAAFANVANIDHIQLSDSGNKIVVPDSIASNADTGADVSVNGAVYDHFAFVVSGGKGSDLIDISGVDASTYIAVEGGGGKGADTIVGSAGDNYFFFAQPGELTAADKINGGDGYDDVVVAGGTYTSDQFKGFKNVEELDVYDSDPTKSIHLTIKDDFLTSSGTEGYDGSKTFSVWVERSLHGNDVIDASQVTSTTNNISTFTGGGEDKIIGGAGNDWIAFDDDGSGGSHLDKNDQVNGGLGWDAIAFENRASPGGASLDDSAFANVTNVEAIDARDDYHGNKYDISITLGHLSDLAGIGQVYAPHMLGNLTVDGTARSDALEVVIGHGNDTVTFGAADDNLQVRESGLLNSSDTIDGGGGINTLQFQTDTTLTDTDLADVTHMQWVRLDGGTYDVTLGANADAAEIEKIDASRSVEAHIDASLMQNDLTILGGKGDDDIKGGTGNDVIVGGAGADALDGGTGADAYTFLTDGDSVLNHMDVISGFDFTGEGDTLDFSALGAAPGVVNGATVGSFGAGPGTAFGSSGAVVETDGTDTRVYVDVNHNGSFDAATDTVVQISGNHLNEIVNNPAAVVL